MASLDTVFDAAMANFAYSSFCKIVGQETMRRSLANSALVESLMYQDMQQPMAVAEVRLVSGSRCDTRLTLSVSCAISFYTSPTKRTEDCETLCDDAGTSEPSLDYVVVPLEEEKDVVYVLFLARGRA